MSRLILKVETVAGSSIEQVAEDICAFSKQMGMIITTDFNGFCLVAGINTSPKNIVVGYNNEVDYHKTLYKEKG